MLYRHLLLCASLSFLAACSGTTDDDISELPCDDGHGCPNGLSCVENVCVGSDASIANDQVQATGEANGAPAVVEVETGGCKGPSCEIAAGSDVTFRAPMLAGYRFTGWGGDERCQGTNPVLMLEDVAANIHCVANYVKRVVISGISADPGASVGAMSNAGFASCEGTHCEVDQGSTVVLTATELSGHRFAGFTGEGCGNLTGNVVTVVAPASDVTCTANYAQVFSVSGDVDGGDGQVVATSSTPVASCNANSCSVDAGGSVTLTAPVSAGYRFMSWSGTGCAGSDPTLVLSDINAVILCTAHYVARFSVTGEAAGLPTPTFVPASSDDLFADCAEGGCEVDEGSTVQLVAPSVSGYVFVEFTGDGCDDPVDLSGSTLTLTDVASDLDCQAQYEPLPPGNVSIVGNIVGAPGVITALPSPPCANGACVITEGSDVTLTAPNLAPTYRFLGWRGQNPQDSEEDVLCTTSALSRVLNDVTRNISCVARYTPRYKVEGASAGGGLVDATSADANSTCSASVCTVDAGKSVTLTAVPTSGYRFDSWTGGGPCSGASPLVVSNVSNNIVCTAHFVRQFNVTYSAGNGGTVSAPSARCANGSPCKVDSGSALDITAVPSSGYRFGSWSGTGCTDTATGTPLVANLGNIAADITCVANFVQQYVVTYAGNTGGSVSAPAATCTAGSPCTVDKGANLALTATPAAGYRFDTWSGTGCTDTVAGTKLVADLGNISANVTCTASFVRQFTVSFPDPAAGAVVASNVSPASNSLCTGTSCLLDQGGSLRLTATADANYRFVSWSGCSTSSSTQLDLGNIAADQTCTAVFVARYQVTFPDPANGAVAASNAGPNPICTSANCILDSGGSIRLTATADANYRFVSWTGCSSSTAAILDLSNITSNLSCTPTFVRQYTVTYAANANGSVSAPAAQCASGSPCTVDTGTALAITAQPNAGYRFNGWTGTGCTDAIAGTALVADLNVTSNVTCTASFVQQVTVSFPDPANGSIAASNAGPNPTCTSTSCQVDVPGTIQLAATADPNYRFTGWSTCSSSTSTPLTLGSINADTTCNANFVRRWNVAGSTSGTPAGVTVSASASQSSPQATCTNVSPGAGNCVVDQGVNVTLTASAVANYDISSWTGTGCAVGALGANNSTLTFTAVSAAASCAPVYTARVTITIAKTPSDIPNAIQISGPGCTANGASCTVPSGSAVTLTAGNSAASDFLAWKGTQCNGTTASLTFTATQNQTCTADFSGYWAMLFSQSNAAGETYNAILPVKNNLYVFGTRTADARSASLNPNSGVMIGSEQLDTFSTFTFNWLDAANIADHYAALGRVSGRAFGGILMGDGPKGWLRQIQSKYTSIYNKLTDLNDSYGVCGLTNTGYARVILAKLDSLASTADVVQPLAEAFFQRLSSCDKGAPTLTTNARGISALKSGGYAVVSHTANAQLGIAPTIWMTLAKDDLTISNNGQVLFEFGKINPTAITIGEVLPTPDLGGFLIVGSMTLRDEDGLVVKVDDALKPEWGYYFENPNYDDAFSGATIATDGDFVLVGATSSDTQGLDGWFVRMSKDGKTIVRNRAIGTSDPLKGSKDEDFWDVRPAPNGGFFIAGRAITATSAWALHVDEAGNVPFQAAVNGHNTALTYVATDLHPSLGAASCLDQSVGDASFSIPTLTSTTGTPTATRQAW